MWEGKGRGGEGRAHAEASPQCLARAFSFFAVELTIDCGREALATRENG